MKDSNVENTVTAKQGYLRFFEDLFHDGLPLARLIRTKSGFYLYDTGTNRILDCGQRVFALLNDLLGSPIHEAVEAFIAEYGEPAFLEAAREIKEAVDSVNILKAKQATQFGLSDHFGDVEAILNTSVQAVCLEITEECNLRCAYCIYHDHFKEKRNYGRKAMSLDVALKAIDFLKAHSSQCDQVFVGFYGGEPLMRFPFIKSCVDYAWDVMGDRDIVFNVTTNATLVTPEIAEYLFEKGFSVLVSLDGPEPVHDRYRLDKSGKGSYQKTVKGLKLLAEKFKQIKKGQLSINAVYAPPYSAEKIDAINDHIKSFDWLPEVPVRVEYITEGSLPPDFVPEKDLLEDKNINRWAFERYRPNVTHADPMVKKAIEKKFATLMQRPVLEEPLDCYSLNGCCLPGQRKNYITTGGDIHICEKMPTKAPAIGNVFSGFDMETIKRVYVDGYAKESIKTCSRCWAIRLCDLCYIAAFDGEGQMDLKRKTRYCLSKVSDLENTLAELATLIEENPGGLKHLYDYDIQ